MITLGYKLSSEEQSATDLCVTRRWRRTPGSASPSSRTTSTRGPTGRARAPSCGACWAPSPRPRSASPSAPRSPARACASIRRSSRRPPPPPPRSCPGDSSSDVGTGENLNEHVVGQGWPETEVRQARLEEAIEIIRLLWKGGNQSYHGRYFTVENARLYSLPESPPSLYVAVGGPRSADLAGRVADGMIGTEPDASSAGRVRSRRWRRQAALCRADRVLGQGRKPTAKRIATEQWPTLRHGEQPVVGASRCRSTSRPWPSSSPRTRWPSPSRAVRIRSVTSPPSESTPPPASTIICVHQVGKDQKGFFEFYAEEILPQLKSIPSPRRKKIFAQARKR